MEDKKPFKDVFEIKEVAEKNADKLAKKFKKDFNKIMDKPTKPFSDEMIEEINIELYDKKTHLETYKNEDKELLKLLKEHIKNWELILSAMHLTNSKQISIDWDKLENAIKRKTFNHGDMQPLNEDNIFMSDLKTLIFLKK